MLNKQIPTLVGILIVVLLAAGLFGVIFFFCDFGEYDTIKDSEKLKEVAGWKNYTNEKYGFEIKYPYYLLDIDYSAESFKASFPLESEDVFSEKTFSIEIKEEEYDKGTEYYCDQGIPHTSQTVLSGMNLCEVRYYEDVENSTAVRRFSYFLIYNKKWINFTLTLSYCVDKDCIIPSDLDIEKEKENFNQIISTFRFLEEEIIEKIIEEDEFVNWETYIAKEYGLELNLPEEWKLLGEKPEISYDDEFARITFSFIPPEGIPADWKFWGFFKVDIYPYQLNISKWIEGNLSVLENELIIKELDKIGNKPTFSLDKKEGPWVPRFVILGNDYSYVYGFSQDGVPNFIQRIEEEIFPNITIR